MVIASATIISSAVICCRSKGNIIKMCTRPAESQSQQPVQNQSNQPVQQNRTAEYIDVIDENAYDSIEEVSADDTPSCKVSDNDDNDIPMDIDQISTNTSSNECVIVIDGSYKNPYNPLIETIEKHHYKKIESKVDIVFGKEDTSSDSDKNSIDSSGYLKPARKEETAI